MISKITELYILCRDIQVSTEIEQFTIEIISKMTETYILCGDIQIPTEKSVQHRSKNFTLFVETFKSQLKNTDYHSNDYKDDRP